MMLTREPLSSRASHNFPFTFTDCNDGGPIKPSGTPAGSIRFTSVFLTVKLVSGEVAPRVGEGLLVLAFF